MKSKMVKRTSAASLWSILILMFLCCPAKASLHLKPEKLLSSPAIILKDLPSAAGPTIVKATPKDLPPATINCFTQSYLPLEECNALIDLYNSTDGMSWTNNTGWLQDVNPCSWNGIGCAGGHITEVNLANNALTGTVPDTLGDLTSLTSLYLLSNNLSGTIPATFGNLSSLANLYLSGNSLTGNIPSELGNLSNLAYLYLNFNSLTGTIPYELGNLKNAIWLYLDHNNLTGTVSPKLGNLSNLEVLHLSGNSLTGRIPAELGNLEQLHSLYLNNNQFCGLIPISLSNLVNLTDDVGINIQSNYLFTDNTTLDSFLLQKGGEWKSSQGTPLICPSDFSWNLFLPAIINGNP